MPQIGWLEILAVVIIAILVLGPKEFPIALKKIGSYIGKLKNTTNKKKALLQKIHNAKKLNWHPILYAIRFGNPDIIETYINFCNKQNISIKSILKTFKNEIIYICV